MKRLSAFLALVALGLQASAADRVCPASMPTSVEARLIPVLSALEKALSKNDIWDKPYEEAFSALLRAKDKASAEARVALMDYYVGESFDEELVCAVAMDGKRSVRFLDMYDACDIRPKQSPVPRTHSSPTRGYAIKIIKEGSAKESCTFE